MKRREFIRVGGFGVVGAGVLGGLTTDWYGGYAPGLKDPGTDGEYVVATNCELCFWKCGILAHVKDGRVTKLQGNPKDPLSRGHLCPRGAGGTGLLYDPDRLKQPMVRVGSRGGDRFEAVSWDVALDEVAEGFERIRRRHGAEALALFSHGFGGSWFKHLFKAYGSPNVTAPSYAQCRGPREVGFNLTYGLGVGSPETTDIENTRCLTLIGSHLGENMHNTQVQEFATAIRNGADVIVVDPRYSTAASKARYWLPIKPGTDLALLLSWMHVLITEGLYDRDYVERFAVGLEQLRAHVQPYSPEWAYPRTGIEPDLIRASARAMAAARPASLVHPGRHVTWYGNDAQRSRAIAMLNALLGSWGREGGFYLPAHLPVPTLDPAHHPEAPAAIDRPAASDYPLADAVLAKGVCDASIPGHVRADPAIKGWMVYGSNLPTTLPNPKETYAALEALDFVVTIDVLPVEMVGWSDVVLPESTYLERDDDINAPWYRVPYVGLRQSAVAPMYDSRPGWWIARELGQRLGVGDHFAWEDARSYVDARLRAAGLDVEQARRDGVVVGERSPIYFEEGAPAEFYTGSGKIELYSPRLAELGFDPMPTWHDGELEEPPAGYYRLLFGRAPMHTFGRTVNNRLLSETFDENAVWVNARVARKWGLSAGDRIHLKNQDGVVSTFSAPVKVTERIRPDAVYIVHGYGRKAKGLAQAHGRGIDDAELVTRYRTDPLMGGTGMNVNFVTFVRAADVAAQRKAAVGGDSGDGAVGGVGGSGEVGGSGGVARSARGEVPA
jgi:thiosulfate reductase/polysulfide reductase chain A